MKKVHPVNGEDLSQINKQASPTATSQNTSASRRQIASSKVSEKPADNAENIVSFDEYPVNSNNKDNAVLDNNLDIGEEVPKKRAMTNEDENTPSRGENIPENDGNSNISLALEKTHHEQVATLRTNTFRAILSNEYHLTSFEWVKYVSYIFSTIAIAFAMTLPLTIIPIHNPIRCQDYWYEMLFSFTPCAVLFSLEWTTNKSICMNIDYIKGIRRTSLVAFVGSMVLHVILVSAYFIWTHVANYWFPIPHLGGYMLLSLYLILLATFWFSFPFEWRKNNTFRKRMKFLIVIIIHSIAMNAQFNIIYTKLLLKFQNEYQPAIALLFRAILEFNLWIGKHILRRTTDGDVAGAQLMFSMDVGIRYAMIVCFSMENIATFNTEIVLMAIDFVYNVYLSLQIVWTNKRGLDHRNKQMELLQELATNELIEFTTPLVFVLSIAIGYYGPNSKYLINIGATIWHSSPIDNINQTIIAILIFFVVDFCSMIVTSIILWVFCEINLFKGIVALMKDCGPYLCIVLTWQTNHVSTPLLAIPATYIGCIVILLMFIVVL